MNRASSDDRPWYRYPWPWILIAGPAIVVVAGIVTAWIATATSDGLVADDYYKQGLEVNQMLARDEAAATMGLEARLRLMDGRVEVDLASRAEAPLPERLRIKLVHPTRSGEDRELILSREKSVYVGEMTAPGPGRWRVMVEDEAATWRITGNVRLPDAPDALLKANGKR
ncbi:MAG: FixH family protein [Zoogloeaceae bacterium]|jgi:hypothetical protein|nr:FixH family protein [Zoogloeaceae bacterium]